MNTINQAAWITELKGTPLKVDVAPYTKPGPGQFVTKNVAVAINHVDWQIQETGKYIESYPNILGEDIAGEVVEVGEGATRFKQGDLVISHTFGFSKDSPAYGGFQLYTLAEEAVSSPIPPSLPFENAVALPLSISTAAEALYASSSLGLPLPTTRTHLLERVGKSIVIWGAASSVGSAAVQLAAASGVDVIGTASPRNHAYVRELGAKDVMDYHSPRVTNDVAAAIIRIGGTFCGVFDAVGTGGWEKIAQQLGGKVSTVALPEDIPSDVTVFGGTFTEKHPQLSNAIWRDFVPQALATGQLKAKPDSVVLTGGLARIQEGLDRQRKGSSASKIVVKLR